MLSSLVFKKIALFLTFFLNSLEQVEHPDCVFECKGKLLYVDYSMYNYVITGWHKMPKRGPVLLLFESDRCDSALRKYIVVRNPDGHGFKIGRKYKLTLLRKFIPPTVYVPQDTSTVHPNTNKDIPQIGRIITLYDYAPVLQELSDFHFEMVKFSAVRAKDK